MAKPTKEFLEFIEMFNDYRGYEDFLGNVRAVVRENNLRSFKTGTPIYTGVFEKFYCPPFSKHFLFGLDLDIVINLIFDCSFPSAVVTEEFRIFCSRFGVFEEILATVERLKKEGNFPPTKEDTQTTTIGISARMYFTAEGHYKEFIETELFHNIDFSRVRMCICGNCFWASRIDKFTCSLECGNRVRQQKFLNDSERRKEYNAKRLQYYHENKDEMKRRKLKRSK